MKQKITDYVLRISLWQKLKPHHHSNEWYRASYRPSECATEVAYPSREGLCSDLPFWTKVIRHASLCAPSVPEGTHSLFQNGISLKGTDSRCPPLRSGGGVSPPYKYQPSGDGLSHHAEDAPPLLWGIICLAPPRLNWRQFRFAFWTKAHLFEAYWTVR